MRQTVADAGTRLFQDLWTALAEGKEKPVLREIHRVRVDPRVETVTPADRPLLHPIQRFEILHFGACAENRHRQTNPAGTLAPAGNATPPTKC